MSRSRLQYHFDMFRYGGLARFGPGRTYDSIAAVCGLFVVLVFAVRPVLDSMFLFSMTGFTHLFLGFYRQMTRGKRQTIRVLTIFSLAWLVVLTLPIQTTLAVTIALIFVHYALDNFYLFGEKVSLPSILALSVLFLLSLFGEKVGSSVASPISVGVYVAVFFAICVWRWRLQGDFNSRVFAEIVLIAVLAAYQIVHSGFGSLFYLYLPVGSLHYLNWYVSLESHFRGDRVELRRYRSELAFIALICTGGSAIYFYSETTYPWMEYIFGAPYFCAWICTHIVANFNVSQINRILPSSMAVQ